MTTLAYVTLEYSDHQYTATVSSTTQLEDYLSRDPRPFKIVGVELKAPEFAEQVQVRDMVNRVSRFGHCLNNTAACN